MGVCWLAEELDVVADLDVWPDCPACGVAATEATLAHNTRIVAVVTKIFTENLFFGVME
jgi:hypothetical protein